MLKAGWATVYSQSGAEYGSVGEEAFKTTEEQAKCDMSSWLFVWFLFLITRNRKGRRGMYAKGALIETPAEYKRRHARASADPEQGADTTPPMPPQKPSLLSRLLGRK
jgi:hypothetical protein